MPGMGVLLFACLIPVAKVGKNGKIRALAPGTCDIWIFAMNGVSKKVKVVVQ